MKTFLIILFFIPIFSPSYGQEDTNLSRHQLSADFGSFRNRYIYPITNLKYSSPITKKTNLKFSARLRSYGTLYFYSKCCYDFTPIAEYYFTKTIKPLYFSIGIGTDARIRIVNDKRTEVKNSAEPLISASLHGYFKKISFTSPLWTRFYSNGISFSLLPEASYQITKKLSLFLRYELSHLTIYKASTQEWRQDCFVGITFTL